jgi:dihydroflavonol-4-reductase
VRVLVTGATGFTGSHLARTLASRGYQVRVFQREASREPDVPGMPGIDVTIGDLRDPAAVARAVADVEVVYHIAAIYRQAGVSRDVYRAVTATAVGQIVEAAASAGVRRQRGRAAKTW